MLYAFEWNNLRQILKFTHWKENVYLPTFIIFDSLFIYFNGVKTGGVLGRFLNSYSEVISGIAQGICSSLFYTK